jgi:hypothetical protein
MKGAFVVEVAVGDLSTARAALARAVASGAFGPGHAVERDGDGFRFTGADSGRVELTSDGRVTYEVATRRRDFDRLTEAVLVAVLVAVTATLGWSLPPYQALPVGAAAAIGYGVSKILVDRLAVRRRIYALVSSLPVLVDAGRK